MGNMILIKDRHLTTTANTIPTGKGNMILIKDRHNDNKELVHK